MVHRITKSQTRLKQLSTQHSHWQGSGGEEEEEGKTEVSPGTLMLMSGDIWHISVLTICESFIFILCLVRGALPQPAIYVPFVTWCSPI